jgi:hypothetical protein
VGRPGDAHRAASARSRGARRGARGAAYAARGGRARTRGSARDPGCPHPARVASATRLGAGRRLPAIEAERVSGDFYLVAEGPQDSTLLVIGDVVGHGLQAGRRAAFVRTTFAATAPFSDDPRRLLSWAITALVERAGTSSDFVTAACVTFDPNKRVLRWAYAGHPPAVWMQDGQELAALRQGRPLGLEEDPDYTEGRFDSEAPRACCSIPTD